jgi:translation initiation factor 2 subunit 2
MDYHELLKKGRNELPESVSDKERFEIPKVKGHLEGNKTIITNLVQIAQTMERPIQHLLKFILREIGAPGTLRKNEVIIGRKVPSNLINEKIKKYATQFIFCQSCGKPDTVLIEENNTTYLKCNACGAKEKVKSKI